MITAVREIAVAKKKTDGQPGRQEARPLTTVKVDKDLLRRARTIASYRGLDLGEYVDAILRPVVDRDFAQIVRPDAR